LKALVTWFGGVLIGAFLVVTDEILTEAQYCGRTCLYPYPLLGGFSLYNAYSIAFGAILAGIVLTILALLPARGQPLTKG